MSKAAHKTRKRSSWICLPEFRCLTPLKHTWKLKNSVAITSPFPRHACTHTRGGFSVIWQTPLNVRRCETGRSERCVHWQTQLTRSHLPEYAGISSLPVALSPPATLLPPPDPLRFPLWLGDECVASGRGSWPHQSLGDREGDFIKAGGQTPTD